jgi:hypothetical protein
MGQLLEVNEGHGRISFHSLLSFLPSRMKLPFPSLTITLSSPLIAYGTLFYSHQTGGVSAIGLIIGQETFCLGAFVVEVVS